MASVAVPRGTALATVPNEGPARDDGWRPLAAGWVVLPTDRLAGFPAGARPRERRFLLMHADYGIVVLELWSAGAAPGGAPPTAAWLEAELRLAGFLRRFDPRLPIRRIHLATPELPRLVGVLTRAFAGTEPLRLPCGDAWMGAVQATLAAAPGAAPAPAAASRPRAYPRPARWRGVAAGAAGTIALGGVVVAALLLAEGRPGPEPPRAGTGEGPAVAAAPISAAPPPAAVMARASPVQADARPEPDASAPMTPFTAWMAPPPEPEAALDPPFGATNATAAEPLPSPEAAPSAPSIAIDTALADALPAPEAAQPGGLAAMMRSAPSPDADAPGPMPLPRATAEIAHVVSWPGLGMPRPALPTPAVLGRAPATPADGDILGIALPPPFMAAPLPLPADAARIAPLPEPGGAPHPAQRMPRDAGALPIAPLPTHVVPRFLPISLAGIDIPHLVPLPMPAAPRPVRLPPAVADIARIAPLPEPDALRLPPLAPAVVDVVRVAPPPELATLRLAQLASAGADTERAAPMPEPDTARLPSLAPGGADTAQVAPLPAPEAPQPAPPAAGGADAARTAPPPEPGPPRIAQRAPGDVGTTPAAPLPEIEAQRPAPAAPVTPAAPSDLGTTRAVPPPSAPASHDTRRVVPPPAPAPEAPRVVPPAAEAARPPPTVAPPAAAAPAPATTLDPKVIELLITRGNEMLARGDISAARLLFGRAAAGGSVAALIAMGRSYDPAVLGALGVRGIRPDPEQAALWYRRAAERGAAPDGRSER